MNTPPDASITDIVAGIAHTMMRMRTESKARRNIEIRRKMPLLYTVTKPVAPMNSRWYKRVYARAHGCCPTTTHKLEYRVTRDPETYAPILHVRAL